eukprot:gb/GFBE01070742.1/.p1 GENE.gb/GFBE01070742.1/~~gb/GFBE01070742.1/.p1  ORF type:complete len:131 (+),score=17.80 gb/GFBE01070742.1/:1-393(+)
MALRVLGAFKGSGFRLRLLQGNIADWQGDCIVNAANVQLEPSNLPDYWRHIGRKDVNSVLHARAGPGLAEECASLPLVAWEVSQQDRVACAPGWSANKSSTQLALITTPACAARALLKRRALRMPKLRRF